MDKEFKIARNAHRSQKYKYIHHQIYKSNDLFEITFSTKIQINYVSKVLAYPITQTDRL